MCTVTFIPSGDSFFITHSRDESSVRAKALPPAMYTVNDFALLFPKDPKGGGTWIALNETGNAALVLNGGFTSHIPAPPYRKSRGLILLEIIASQDMLLTWQRIDLNNIEPFTTVLFNDGLLYETRWDGARKHASQLNHLQSHIWSSTTLYDSESLLKRKSWFEEWLQKNPHPSLNSIIGFHRDGGDGDSHNAICMNRDDCFLTVSISSAELTSKKGILKYFDMGDNSFYQEEITFTKYPVEN